MGWWRAGVLACVLAVGACAADRFEAPAGVAVEPDAAVAYGVAHPFYAEFCALTQVKKLQGFGAEILGGIGGHAVFYLNGVCQVPGYPELAVCGGEDGVGLSMNEHFSNAKWVATPGQAFFFDGGLAPGAALTQASYVGVKAEARRRGIYDGVVFHTVVFEDKPAGWSDEEWKYEVSAATDYAVGMGRGRYCARVPVSRGQMGKMVTFLNAENAPYRRGERVFRWSIFTDNCIHLAHNALAAAGLLAPWAEHDMPLAVLTFPVPKNEFVNLAWAFNDAWPTDPGTLYADLPARAALLAEGRTPAGPGALVEAVGPRRPNAVYDTDVRLIFFDEPNFGWHPRRFAEIMREGRYWDEGVNRAHFAGLARAAQAARRPLAWWLARAPYRDDPAGFRAVYEAYYGMVERLAGSSRGAS